MCKHGPGAFVDIYVNFATLKGYPVGILRIVCPRHGVELMGFLKLDPLAHTIWHDFFAL